MLRRSTGTGSMWRLAHDTIGTSDLGALADWLRTEPRLTQGPLVAEFEDAWSDWLGVEHSVMVGSGTAANLALVLAAERRLGRKPVVGVAAVTWATNVTPSLLLGHPVVIFDIDSSTLGVDEGQVISAIVAGAIDILFITHLVGFDALTDAILDAVNRWGVTLLEDCCEAHGVCHGDVKVGTFGLGSTFSFYFGHHMSTIEGGMVSTNDPKLADEVRLIRSHGLARESSRSVAHARAHPDIDERFLFVSPGLNLRSTDLNAFLGLRQLVTLDDRINARNRNLEALLAGLPVRVRNRYRTEGASSFALPLVADDEEAARSVRRVVDELGIESRPVVAGNLARQPFLAGFDVTVYPTPHADHLHRLGLYVGNGHHVTTDMVGNLTRHLTEELAP